MPKWEWDETCSITLKRENTLTKGRHWRSQKDASIIKPTFKRLTSTNISPQIYKLRQKSEKLCETSVETKCFCSQHRVFYFLVAVCLLCLSILLFGLLPHRCNAFLCIFPICCHTVAMRFYTYSLFVATPLQCVSVHIPYLLPLLCNTLVAKWLCKKAKSAMRCPQFGFTKI